MTKTTMAKAEEAVRKWYVVDASDQPAGRLAVRIANVLRGRTKVTFTPHADTGDFVCVINAAKVKLSGNKEEQKIYQDYTGYNSGLKLHTARQVRARHPERIITQAVRGMLPKNRSSRRLMTRLKVYPGADHPHAAQQPEPMLL